MIFKKIIIVCKSNGLVPCNLVDLLCLVNLLAVAIVSIISQLCSPLTFMSHMYWYGVAVVMAKHTERHIVKGGQKALVCCRIVHQPTKTKAKCVQKAGEQG